MSYQLKKLAKEGKPGMKAQYEKLKGMHEKRDFYYNVFLLDPSMSSKEVHKESLEKASSTSSTVRGWMTKWEIGKIQGATPELPNFESLCDKAVEGLKERPHEVAEWAAMGIKQYYGEKKLLDKDKQKNQSLMKAVQNVDQLGQQDFEQVERALLPSPSSGTVMLGSQKALVADQPPPAIENTEADVGDTYKKAYKGLKQAINSLGGAVDRLELLKQSLKKAPASEQQAQTSMDALQLLAQEYVPKKTQWLEQLAQYTQIWEGDEAEGNTKVGELSELKKECDSANKSLTKAVAPHKLWAKNNGFSKWSLMAKSRAWERLEQRQPKGLDLDFLRQRKKVWLEENEG